jgi:hypothetical protein
VTVSSVIVNPPLAAMQGRTALPFKLNLSTRVTPPISIADRTWLKLSWKGNEG